MAKKDYTKKVLVVDDEKLFLASLTEGMKEFADEFDIVTAHNGKAALDKLRSEDIHLVVTDLKMPTMDGFQLLLHMLNEFPDIPIIVMTAYCTPDIEAKVQELDAFELMEKPIDLNLLAQKIGDGLQQNSEGHLKGIMLFSFLQLIEIEKKTCLLRVKSGDRKGSLHFLKGVLIDAVYEKMVGLEAANEIVCWEETEINIMNSNKNIRRRINKSLQNILMDAAKNKDEAEFDQNNGSLGHADWFDELSTPKDFVPKPSEQTNELPPAGKRLAGSESVKTTVSVNNTNQKQKEQKIKMANNIEQSLNDLLTIDGAVATALVDSNSGMALGMAGSGVNLEVAAAGNTEVIKSKQQVMSSLGLKDSIEDILISLGTQYHLIRPLKEHKNLFFYLVLGREKSNLAMARFKLSEVENNVAL